MKFDKWHFFRAFAWTVMWIIANPEIASVGTWKAEPIWGLRLLVMYLVSGGALELIYRKLAWGKARGNGKQLSEDSSNPWISLDEHSPQLGKEVEVYCADGNVREGMAVERERDGEVGIVVKFEAGVEQSLINDALAMRPTHWRRARKK